jgi:hypothetical protein
MYGNLIKLGAVLLGGWVLSGLFKQEPIEDDEKTRLKTENAEQKGFIDGLKTGIEATVKPAEVRPGKSVTMDAGGEALGNSGAESEGETDAEGAEAPVDETEESVGVEEDGAETLEDEGADGNQGDGDEQ